jgi:hypothetical protein
MNSPVNINGYSEKEKETALSRKINEENVRIELPKQI